MSGRQRMLVPRPEQQRAARATVEHLAKPVLQPQRPSVVGVRPAYLRSQGETEPADAPKPQRTGDRQMRGAARHPAPDAAAHHGPATPSHGKGGGGSQMLAQHTGRHLLGAVQAAAGDAPAQVATATRETESVERTEPIAFPDTGPYSISREPLSISLRSTGFDAPRTLDLTAGRAPAKDEGALPAALADFRSLFAQAAEQAVSLHRRLVEEAGRIAGRWSTENGSLGDEHQGALDLHLDELDSGLAEARAELQFGRETLLGMISAQAQAVSRRIDAAAGGALKALSDRNTEYQTALETPRSSRATIEYDATSGQASVATAARGAQDTLAKFLGNPAAYIPSFRGAVQEAVREAKIDFVPSRIGKASEHVRRQAESIDKFLSASFRCLPCEFDSAFQELDTRVQRVAVLGPQAVGGARDGGLKSVKDTQQQLSATVVANHAAVDRMLVQQHNRLRGSLIAAAEQNAKRERDSVQDNADRQSDMLVITASAQPTAVRQVYDWLASEARTQSPHEFAGTVARSSLRLRANLEGIGAKQPSQTLTAVDRLIDKTRFSATQFNNQQGRIVDDSGRASGESVRESIDRLAEQITATCGRLEDLPVQVRSSANGFLDPMGEAFTTAVKNLTTAVAATGTRVKQALEGTPGGGGETANKSTAQTVTPASQPGRGNSQPRGPPAAPPASCGGCGPEAKAPPGQTGPQNQPTGTQQGNASEGAGGADANTPKTARELWNKVKGDPTEAPEIKDFFHTVGQSVPEGLGKRLEQINSALAGIFGPNIDTLMASLRGLTQKQGTAIRFLHDTTHSESLDRRIERRIRDTVFSAGSTDTANIQAAIGALNGNAVDAAMSELTAAFNYSNEDERIRQVLLSLTPQQMSELNATHGAELDELAKQLDGEDLRLFNELRAGNTSYYEATAVRRDIDQINQSQEGVARGDALAERITRASHDFHSALQGDPSRRSADLFNLEDPEAVRTRDARHWEQLQVTFGTLPGVMQALPEGGASTMPGSTLLAYATRPITHPAQTYGDEGGGMGVTEPSYQDVLNPYHRNWIEQILAHGAESDEARGAQVLVERRRTTGSTESRLGKLDSAVRVESGEVEPRPEGAAGATGPPRSIEERRDAIFLASERYRFQIEGGSPPPATAADARALVQQDVAAAFPGDANARAIATASIQNNAGNPRAVIDFAIAHESTTLALTYLRRMNRSQIDEVVASWNHDHPNGPDLYRRLGLFENHWSLGNMNGAVFSGDKANDLEIAFMGVPRNDRERAEVALRVMNQQIEQSGALGRLLAGEEFDALQRNAQALREQMGVSSSQIDLHGRIIDGINPVTGGPLVLGNFDAHGNFVPPQGGDVTPFETAIGMSRTVAHGYTEATDRIANYITTALVVAAAVITTALTGGAAASIWIPVLITAGAGLVGMGLTAAIKGGRYSRDEVVRDLAMTVVQAATAGIASGAGAALRGGTPALKALATSWRVSEAGLAAAAGQTTLRSLTLFEELAIGAGSGALTGGTAAAFDPNRDREDGGAGIVHGILRGALGGAAGAGATRAVMGGVGSLARGLGARSGAASALASEASLEQAAIAAARSSRALSTSRLVEVGGRALASGVSGVASRGTELAYERGVQGREVTGAQVFEELGTAFLQNFGQGLAEGAVDRAIRSRSQSRMSEHEFTQRGEEHEYQRVGAEAAMREAERRGLIPLRAQPTPEPEQRLALPAPVRPRAPPEPEGRPTRPTRVMAEEAQAPRPATGRIEPGEPEAPARPTRVLPGEAVEQTSSRTGHGELETAETERAPIARTEDAPPKPRVPANDNPALPTHQRVALADIDPATMPRWSENSVFVHPDSRNLHAANDNFGRLINADPSREVAIHYNVTTGEYIVVQGGPGSVATIRPGGEVAGERGTPRLALKSGLVDPKGPWVLYTHFHPNRPGQTGTPLIRRLPSTFARAGDFAVIHFESTTLGQGRRSSRIYFNDEGRVSYTDFGIEPGHAKGQYWVDYPDPVTGQRVREHFHEPADYDRFVAKIQSNPELASAGAGGPIARSADTGVDAPVQPRALTPESTATTLSHEDRFAVRELANAIEELTEHRRMLGVMADQGASESLMTATRGWIGDFEASSRSMVHAMGLVGEPESMSRLHLIMNDVGLSEPLRQAIADRVVEATRAHLIATGSLAEGEPLMLLLHGAPIGRARSMVEGGIDMAQLGTGREDDFGRAAYFTTGVSNAEQYARRIEGERGAIFPFLLRGRDMGIVVDVRPGGTHRAEWEAFMTANYHRYRFEEGPQPGLLKALRERRLPAFGDFNGFGPRGVAFEDFLAHLAVAARNPSLVKPDMVLGELGGPFTTGIGSGDQQAARTGRIVDEMNRQMGSRPAPPEPEADTPIARTQDEPTPLPAATPPRRSSDEADRMVEDSFNATFDTTPGAQHGTPEEREARARAQVTREAAAVNDAVKAFIKGGGEQAEIVRWMLERAPTATNEVLHALGSRTEAGAGTALSEQQAMRLQLELRDRGVPPDLAAAMRARFSTAVDASGPLHRAIATAAESTAWAGFDRDLQTRADLAVERRLDLQAARDVANWMSGYEGSDPQRLELQRLVRQDRNAVVACLAGTGPQAERLDAYFRARTAAGVSEQDALRDVVLLSRIVDQQRVMGARQRWRENYRDANIVAEDLASMVRKFPDQLLPLAFSAPDHLAETRARMLVDLIPASEAGNRNVDATRFAEYIKKSQETATRSFMSEMSAVASVLGSAGLRLLKADVTTGRTNQGGLDIIGFGALPGHDITGPHPVRVVIYDDKALQTRMLESVSAMTGDRFRVNLFASAAEIERRVNTLRSGPAALDPQVAEFITGATKAIVQMRAAAAAIAKIPGPPPGTTMHDHVRSDAYVRAVAQIMRDNNIALVITSAYGRVDTLAIWLRHQGFYMDNEYLRRLARELRRAGVAR